MPASLSSEKTRNMQLAGAASRLAPGFENPVHDAQRCFRTLMQAMARPGSLQGYRSPLTAVPSPLTPEGAAIALTLLDYDTPVWLDPLLADAPDAVAYLRFHTGAPVVDMPVEAAFALVSTPDRLANLGNFAQGTPDYPDRSTTLILMGQTLDASGSVELSGPGIKGSRAFGASPVTASFWQQVQANNAQFPRGVDLVFAGRSKIAAIPRSTTLKLQEG